MRLFLSLALLSCLQPGHAAQDVPATGFSLSPAPFPATSFLAASATLSGGDFVVFDGLEVVHHAGDGSPFLSLGTLPAQVIPSFCVLDAREEFVCFGESSQGNVYRLFLGVSGAPELLATLPFNYDGTLYGPNLYVSAATCGFFCGNEIWRVDLASHQASLLASVPGASGPLTTTPRGDLFYGSVSDSFPPPQGHASVWKWSRAEIEGPQLLGLADADLVGGGFEGAARLAYDRRHRSLYLAEVNFATGENRIVQVRGDADQSPVLVEGRTFFGTGSLNFHVAPGEARFDAFQPESGGVLTYTATDFFTSPERLQVRPGRPQASLSAPAPGQVRLSLVDGPAHGFARIFVGPSHLVASVEPRAFFSDLAPLPAFPGPIPAGPRSTLVPGPLPLFFGLDLATALPVPGLFPLSATGGLRLLDSDPGGASATVAIQMLLYDSRSRLVATSTVGTL